MAYNLPLTRVRNPHRVVPRSEVKAIKCGTQTQLKKLKIYLKQ